MKAAHFGVAVWSAESLDRLTIEALQRPVLDLNNKTRFTESGSRPAQNATGVAAGFGLDDGLPDPHRFCRGYPEHDVWRFDANRLVDTGEADAALWISAYGATVPGWRRRVPFVALTTTGTTFPYPPKMQIEVGTPGHRSRFRSNWRAKSRPSRLRPLRPRARRRSVADVIGQISEHLKGNDAC